MKMRVVDYLKLGEDPEGVRLELAHGEIVLHGGQSFEHAIVLTKLGAIVTGHTNERDLRLVMGDYDTIFDEWNARRPDILFVAKNRLHLMDRGKHGLWFVPDLCVEGLSRETVRVDCGDKFALYEGAGVRHYWIVDPANRTFHAYELRDGSYFLAVTGNGNDCVRAGPFPELQIALEEVWEGIDG